MPKVLAVSKSTRPKEVQQAIELHYGQKIGYQAAHTVLKELRRGGTEAERENFRKVPASDEAPESKVSGNGVPGTGEDPGDKAKAVQDNSGLNSDSSSGSSLPSVEILEPCEPPSVRPPRDRPSKRQKRKGDVREPQALHRNLATPATQEARVLPSSRIASGSSAVDRAPQVQTNHPGRPKIPASRAARRCGVCGGGGHNSRTCRRARR